MATKTTTNKVGRKSQGLDTQVIGLRLPKEDLELVEKISREQDRPIASVCRLACRFGLMNNPAFKAMAD